MRIVLVLALILVESETRDNIVFVGACAGVAASHNKSQAQVLGFRFDNKFYYDYDWHAEEAKSLRPKMEMRASIKMKILPTCDLLRCTALLRLVSAISGISVKIFVLPLIYLLQEFCANFVRAVPQTKQD